MNRYLSFPVQSAMLFSYTDTKRKLLVHSAIVWIALAGSSCASVYQEATDAKLHSSLSSFGMLSSYTALLPSLDDSLRFHPGKAREYYVKGAILQMQERSAEAILEFQQALRYDKAAAIHFAIAQNYVKLSKQELALEELREALLLDSTFIPAYKLLGELYTQQFRLDEALAVYHYLEARKPEPMNRFMLARLYELRDIDKAISLYSELLKELNDNDALILARLADLYSQKGNTAKALE
ncbi:MAG: hypothetical protein RML40_11145, partial [Bacteroidota bacterium]|nr:hypothetical protein [Candidatus Kapabacteria bacterium]MDW8221070.1 hypothetical protein [Bacteroidota bacterium]